MNNQSWKTSTQIENMKSGLSKKYLTKDRKRLRCSDKHRVLFVSWVRRFSVLFILQMLQLWSCSSGSSASLDLWSINNGTKRSDQADLVLLLPAGTHVAGGCTEHLHHNFWLIPGRVHGKGPCVHTEKVSRLQKNLIHVIYLSIRNTFLIKK